jgi:putative transposase
VRKTYQYRLLPTSEQEQTVETVLSRCRMLYNVALEQRQTWWGRGQGIGASYYQQKRALPDMKAACPDYADVHAHVLPDVILRVERTYAAFFRRVKNGETPGFPRFHGRDRYHSFTFPEYRNTGTAPSWTAGFSASPRLDVSRSDCTVP